MWQHEHVRKVFQEKFVQHKHCQQGEQLNTVRLHRTTPEKIEIGVSTLKTHHILSVHTTITRKFGFAFD